jgi:hypothetical protein
MQSDTEVYDIGHAHAYLCKSAATPKAVMALTGRLVASSSGWLILEVPNALVRGLFDSIHEPGVELPLRDGALNAHISVAHPNEIKKIGGIDKITERGKWFHYQLGPIRTVNPTSWDGVSKVWFVSIKSPELQNLRKSYGLSAIPDDGEKPFHCTFAVKKTNVTRANSVSKAAAVDPEIVIDRPKGFKKIFQTGGGSKEFTYPLDYGYFKGLINPQDNEDADVFVGTGGPHHGRFMKGNMTTGTWQPDEHKWYHGLHDHELKSLQDWWNGEHEKGLTRDWTPLKDRAAVLEDIRNMTKQADVGSAGYLTKWYENEDGKTNYGNKPRPEIGYLVEPNVDVRRKRREKKRRGKAPLDQLHGSPLSIKRAEVELMHAIRLDMQKRAGLLNTLRTAALPGILNTLMLGTSTGLTVLPQHLVPEGPKIQQHAPDKVGTGPSSEPNVRRPLSRPTIGGRGPSIVNERSSAKSAAEKLARALNEKQSKERVSLPVIGHYESKGKVGRDSFLYQDPRGDADHFAECQTCHDYTGKSCENFEKGNTVSSTGSCGLYHHGKGSDKHLGNELGNYTKEEAGYVERPVRCDNCSFFDDDESYCELFETLTSKFPSVFHLETKVDPHGCCNAHTARGKKVKESSDEAE